MQLNWPYHPVTSGYLFQFIMYDSYFKVYTIGY